MHALEAQRPIVWTEPWYRDAHNNVRHENLIKRFAYVEPIYDYRTKTSWHGRTHTLRSRKGLPGNLVRLAMDAYWRYWAKGARNHLRMRRLGAKYEGLFCTSDHLQQAAQFPGPVVVDDDDPSFAPERIRVLNRDNIQTVVTTSEMLRDRLISAGLENPCRVIPSGVDLSRLNPAESARLAKQLGKRQGEIVVGFVIPWIFLDSDREVIRSEDRQLQSITYLLEVMGQVWRQESDLQLWLIGQPSPSVEAYASSNSRLRLLGYVPHDKLLNYVANFDIAVYPRLMDLSGRHSIKLVEYMACGCPIVSTDVAEAHLVTDASAGLITPDRDAFANSIIQLARQPQLRRDFGLNGTRFATDYDWDVIAKRYEREVFEPLLST